MTSGKTDMGSDTPPWLDSPEFLALANAWRQAEQVPDIRIAFRNLKAGIAAQWPLSETDAPQHPTATLVGGPSDGGLRQGDVAALSATRAMPSTEEVERTMKDAARYRWIRNPENFAEHLVDLHGEDDLDRAIDEAMEGK